MLFPLFKILNFDLNLLQLTESMLGLYIHYIILYKYWTLIALAPASLKRKKTHKNI